MSPFHRDFKNADNYFLRKEEIIFCKKVLHRCCWRDVTDCENLSDLFSLVSSTSDACVNDIRVKLLVQNIMNLVVFLSSNVK